MPQAWRDILGDRATQGENDGEFWMKFSDFFRFTNYVSHNYNVENWHHAYHLMLDVPDQNWRMPWHWCGDQCSGFIGKVKNEHTSPQTIWVGVHTWDARTYGKQSGDCNQRQGGMHSYMRSSPRENRAYGL